MVEQRRLKVRVYTKGRLHAKAYIFDYSNPTRGNAGVAIVGSSNLTLSGIQSNTELNVVVYDNASNPNDPASGNHGKLTAWFDELWDESQDFEDYLMRELQASWAVQLATPYDVYMKTLYTLVRDRLEGGPATDLMGDAEIFRSLADFQKVAVKQAIRTIGDYGGCFVADVVGLGKSFIGAAIVKHFERAARLRPLIICPKPLEEMWIEYNERYELNAQILPMSLLQEGERGANLLDDVRYRDRDFVLVDESHNFRHSDTQRYRELQNFIAADPERKVCLLTATPRNSRAMDVFNQIKLFHEDDTTVLPIDPPNLREYFKAIAGSEQATGATGASLARLQDVLRHLMIRRTRRHVLRWYGYAERSGRPLREMSEQESASYLDGEPGHRAYINVAGRHQFFPRRDLQTLRYSIEETYNGLYEELRGYLGKPNGSHDTRVTLQQDAPEGELSYARYGLYNYVLRDRRRHEPYTNLQRAGRNLRGLIRTMLFKRFESSVAAFRLTLERMVQTQQSFLTAMDYGVIPAGEKAEQILGRYDSFDDEDDLIDALDQVTGGYRIQDFDVERLRRHIEGDILLMEKMLDLVSPITAEHDDKLNQLKARLAEEPIAGHKCLIFTQYADTARYLYDNLNPGERRPEVEVIYGTDKSKARVVGRFAPKANPQFHQRPGDSEIQLLIATDVLAEGLNMQDCDIVINYDLHWNPVRLIQRFGRIDRIGSENEKIWAFNFLPERGIERHLHLTEVLKRRIEEIHETIGEDAAILDRSERLNPDAMYAIYDGRTGQLSLFEDDDDERGYVDLNEAEESLRRLRQDDPEEFKRIAELRDGIRAGVERPNKGRFVFCQAGRFQQLFLLNEHGEIVSRDVGRVLAAIQATPETPGTPSLPRDHNEIVMRVKSQFTDEVRHRHSQQEYRQSLTLGQQYVLRELGIVYRETDDEEEKQTITILEQAFRQTPTVAVRRSLDSLRRNGVTGHHLVDDLISIYQQHRLQDRLDGDQRPSERSEPPGIVCSMAMV